MMGQARRQESNLPLQADQANYVRDLLYSATDLDKKGDTQALGVYKQALEVLKSTLALSFGPNERNEASKREATLKQYLQMVEERIEVLEAKKAAETPPLSWAQSLFRSKPSPPVGPPPTPPTPPVIHTRTVPRPTTTSDAPKPAPTTPRTRPPPRTAANGAARVRAQNGTTRPGQKSEPDVPKIKGVDSEMQKRILDEILDNNPGVSWDDIAGLGAAKQAIQEIIILPNLRPDVFTGIRAPPKGMLLYGPPGTGKTMLAKAIASESKMTFFAISASSLMSKWVGDGEKMVRALFTIARQLQPSVIFVDEVDSILGQRRDGENDAARRVKTEFLIQFDGVSSAQDDRILVLGATNLPWALDEAARRRLVKRIYIPLPDDAAREYMIDRLLRGQKISLNKKEMKELVRRTNGYSGSDLKALCAEASMGPIREMGRDLINAPVESMRAIEARDFADAVNIIRPSVSPGDLAEYESWSAQYGSWGT